MWHSTELAVAVAVAAAVAVVVPVYAVAAAVADVAVVAVVADLLSVASDVPSVEECLQEPVQSLFVYLLRLCYFCSKHRPQTKEDLGTRPVVAVRLEIAAAEVDAGHQTRSPRCAPGQNLTWIFPSCSCVSEALCRLCLSLPELSTRLLPLLRELVFH